MMTYTMNKPWYSILVSCIGHAQVRQPDPCQSVIAFIDVQLDVNNN